MNEREIAEIRRRFRPDKSNITHIRGCYVNENREIVSQFDQSLALMPQEDAEKILTILKRTLSGTLEKNLMTITFETAQRTRKRYRHFLIRSSRLSAYRGITSSCWPMTNTMCPTVPGTGRTMRTPPQRCFPIFCAASVR